MYFYACLKRVTVFKQEEFDLITKKAGVKIMKLSKKEIEEAYLARLASETRQPEMN